MKGTNGMGKGLSSVVLVVAAAAVLFGTMGFSIQPEEGQKIVVHLQHWTDDLHAVFMAVKLAGAMQEKGADVTLFASLEGARLADSRQPIDMRWGMSASLSRYLKSFQEAGGKIIVCPHCAAAAGMDAESLRPLTRIATEEEVVDMFLGAEKILDY